MATGMPESVAESEPFPEELSCFGEVSSGTQAVASVKDMATGMPSTGWEEVKEAVTKVASMAVVLGSEGMTVASMAA